MIEKGSVIAMSDDTRPYAETGFQKRSSGYFIFHQKPWISSNQFLT